MINGAPSTRPIDEIAKQNFLSWCRDESRISIHDSIDLFHLFSENYRGVLANDDIDEGVELVRINRSNCIGPHIDSASEEAWSTASKMISEKHGELTQKTEENDNLTVTPACLTVLRLLYEQGRKEKSRFSHYLSILPLQHRIPLQWTRKEVELLKYSSAEPFAAACNLQSQYHSYEMLLAEHPGLWSSDVHSLDSFAMAVNWVRSRGFTVCGEPYMIPCADMFNHDPVNQSALLSILPNSDGEVFVMRTIKPIKKGTEIFSSFGKLSNAHLLISYGFTLEDNPFDQVIIPMSLVLDSCKETFMKIQEKSQKGADAESRWASRLKMVENGGVDVSATRKFILSKYDMLPEDITDTVQTVLLTEDTVSIYGVVVNAVNKKLEQLKVTAGLYISDRPKDSNISRDALTLSKQLISGEIRILSDLKVQLMHECMMDSEEEVDEINEEYSNRKRRKRRKR